MSYAHIVIVNWLALLLGLVVTCQAQAGQLYLDAAGGVSLFQVTAHDGDYIQRDLPHDLSLKSAAYRVGVGWQFNERWSVQGSYINLGTIKQDARFVADEDYNPKLSQCLANCATAPPYKMTDAYRGWELTATRTFPFKNWSLFIKGGGAYLRHTFSIVRLDTASFHENKGRFYSAIVGGGVQYKWAYAELDYYISPGSPNSFMGHSQGWPLSKEQVVMWFGFKLPVEW